ncbi:hypothetical protein ABEB36_000971 [Hypothenemus hampei]|uniref:Uncharacterized protein n=1 Tax=Hypothenemus hampei TaxID=57062 RepID=A0ABD1FDN3_HYPHA
MEGGDIASTTRRKSMKKTKSVTKTLRKNILNAFKNANFNLFGCLVCEKVLRQPVTVKCGHTLCMGCLDRIGGRCSKCQMDVRTEEPARINVLIQGLIEKWKERNKINDFANPVVDLIFRPRYVLRSRCVGFQYCVNVQEAVTVKRKRKFHQDVIFEINDLIKKRPCIESKRTKRRTAIKDPSKSFQELLNSMLEEVKTTVAKALRTSWNITEEDVECLLCTGCLIDPVTTPCGHTFCRDCLTRVLDHRLSCPLCVSRLAVGDYFRGTTQILDQAIQMLFPQENLKGPPGSHEDCTVQVPVFVCTNAFPGVACTLYVNAPRYRLLIRRCLQNKEKTFAMTSTDVGSKFSQFGTVLEVRDALMLEDGRIVLSTIGRKRFKVINTDEKDGYDTAVIEYISDVAPKKNDILTLMALHNNVYIRAVKWVRSLSDSALFEVERLIGRMPRVEHNWPNLPDGPSWTWWLIPILPCSSQLQVGFLSSTSLEKRLRAIDKMLEHVKHRMNSSTSLSRKQPPPVSYTQNEENSYFCSE